MSERKHYDGDTPEQPLDPGHFSEAERKAARDLGDGSPGIDPRRSETPKKEEPASPSAAPG